MYVSVNSSAVGGSRDITFRAIKECSKLYCTRMILSSRKEKILTAVVDSYIASAQPISSQEIRDKHLPSVSSATIRNELVSLEEMGYLVQPHTSAGRIPTAEAYRLYVQRLMPKRKLSRTELQIVKSYFDDKILEIEDMLKSTVKVLTKITNLTSVAYAPRSSDSIVQSIKFVKIAARQILAIVVTDRGVINDTVMNTVDNLSEQDTIDASDFVTSVLKGHSIARIASGDVVAEACGHFRSFFDRVLAVICKYASDSRTDDIVIDGSSKILEQPEYTDIGKARAMLTMLETKDKLVPILQSQGDMTVSIKIGRDDELSSGVPECAVVTATYTVGGKSIGNVGVIGPIRMDYPKIVSLLDYISKAILFE